MIENLNQLRDECHALAKEKGWWPDGERNVGEALLLVISELTEAFEHIRNGHAPNDSFYDMHRKPDGFPVEIVDALVRLFDLSGGLGIDLDEIYQWKMEYNRTRSHRHGGKRA